MKTGASILQAAARRGLLFEDLGHPVGLAGQSGDGDGRAPRRRVTAVTARGVSSRQGANLGDQAGKLGQLLVQPVLDRLQRGMRLGCREFVLEAQILFTQIEVLGEQAGDIAFEGADAQTLGRVGSGGLVSGRSRRAMSQDRVGM